MVKYMFLSNDNNGGILRWWTMISVQALIFVAIAGFGYLTTIWGGDKSYLSSLIFVIYIVATALVGVWHLTDTPSKNIDEKLKLGWFTAESLLALGMIGTVIGFLILLSTSFNSININDPMSLKATLGIMANGMGTSLYTTLAGLVCSLFLKGQLINLELTVTHWEQELSKNAKSKR